MTAPRPGSAFLFDGRVSQMKAGCAGAAAVIAARPGPAFFSDGRVSQMNAGCAAAGGSGRAGRQTVQATGFGVLHEHLSFVRNAG
jgi:hypothetical protein